MKKAAYQILSLAAMFVLTLGLSSPALASSAFSLNAQGIVYYVSTNGSDTNPGTSTAPFKTFVKAVSVLAPGDTLQVMPGTYTESLRVTVSGTDAAPITVIGNGAILDMRGIVTTGISISGSYINLSNFEVTRAQDAGISIPGKFVTVKNNFLYHDVAENGIGTCGAAGSHSSALKVGVGGQNITIDTNTVHNNCGEGIAITRGVGVVVKNNTVYDNFAPNIYIDNSPYTIVEDNTVYCTGAVLTRDGKRPTGLGFGEEYYAGWGAQLHDVTVRGNTIRDCGKGIGAFKSEVSGTFTNITITSNYIPRVQDRAISLSTSSNMNVVISYNTLYNDPYISDPAGVALIGNIIIGNNAFVCASGAAAMNANVSDGSMPVSTLTAETSTETNGSLNILDKDTTGVFRPSNGLLYLKNSNTSGFADVAINYGMAGDCPVVGDWDGNGTATIGIYRDGTFYLRNSNTIGFADMVFAFGLPGDQPIAGDWDGDGKDTIGVYRPYTGQFFLRNSNAAGAPDATFSLGIPGDVAIAGDWNGDGKDTTGVFRPSNGVIFLKNTNATGFADIDLNYGLPGDQPVTGDWDGDGIDTIGVYRGGQFYLRNSNTVGFADLVFALGIPGDMPIAGNWDGSP